MHQGQLTVQYPSGLDHVPNGRRAVLLHFKGLRLNWALLYFLMTWWIFNINSEQNSVTDRLRPFFLLRFSSYIQPAGGAACQYCTAPSV